MEANSFVLVNDTSAEYVGANAASGEDTVLITEQGKGVHIYNVCIIYSYMSII
jgi:hypothetical protein